MSEIENNELIFQFREIIKNIMNDKNNFQVKGIIKGKNSFGKLFGWLMIRV